MREFLAGPIVITLFNHGSFTHHDALMTAESTRAFSFGIIGFMLAKVFSSGFYAKQNLFFISKISALCMATNLVFNFLLISKFQHVGLATSTSLSATVNASCLFFGLTKKKYYSINTGLLHYALKICFSASIMVIILIFLTPHFPIWLQSSITWRIWHLSLEMSVAALSYLMALKMFGFRFRIHFFKIKEQSSVT